MLSVNLSITDKTKTGGIINMVKLFMPEKITLPVFIGAVMDIEV